jgi:hypothetical protein
MPDVWIYVFGGIVISAIAMTIGYNLLSNAINYSQRQDALSQFSDMCSTINTVCLQEAGNFFTKTFRFSMPVRVVYATDDTTKILPKVIDAIKNQESSSGSYVCMQLKDEQDLRCYPQPPAKLPCIVNMPHMGVLPETEDIFVAVSKILGRSPMREYTLLINKTAGNEVTVSIV